MESIERKHIGARSELLASAWLMERGYTVYRNVSPCGLADIIAANFNTGEVLLIDVKTAASLSVMGRFLTEKQIKSGIIALLVSPDGIGFALNADRPKRINKKRPLSPAALLRAEAVAARLYGPIIDIDTARAHKNPRPIVVKEPKSKPVLIPGQFSNRQWRERLKAAE